MGVLIILGYKITASPVCAQNVHFWLHCDKLKKHKV